MTLNPRLIFFALLIAAQPSAGFAAPPVSQSLGVNIHFTDPRPGEMQLLADAGFKTLRMDFSWAATEPKKGQYNFEPYDRLLKSMEPHQLRALFILDYANPLYDEGQSPHTDIGRAAMARWAAAAVTHFKGKAILWEMWNEPNIAQFWKPKPNPQDYAELAIEVGKAIKSAAPDERYIGPATSKIDLVFLEECFKAGCLQYWDAVSIHPYRQKPPETVTEEYRKLRWLIDRYAPPDKAIPIYSGEWGYSATWRSFDEALQGKYLPRQWLINLYNEVPLSIWYDWHDDGPDPTEPEHHFGTVKHPYKSDQPQVYDPKPAYLAAAAFARQLGGLAYDKRLALERGEDYCLLFTSPVNDVDLALAVWTTAADPHSITIPASPGQFRVTDHRGQNTTTLEANDKGLTITLTDAPQYVTPARENALLRAAAKWKRVPPYTFVKAPATAQLPGADVPIERGDQPQRVRVRLALPTATFEQETLIAPSNPIRVEPLPVMGQTLAFDIHNPTGEPFAAELRLDAAKGLELAEWTDQPIQLEAGQTSARISYTLKRADPTYELRYEIWRNRRGDRVHNIAQPSTTRRFRTLAEFNLPDSFKLTPDGDKSLQSEQTLAIARSPTPLPTGDQPSALKLTYAFPDGWKYLRLQPAADTLRKIEGKPTHLSLWVHGDASANVLKLRFIDAKGQTFQPEGHKIDFKRWQLITLPLDGSDATHWGPTNNPGDGQVHHPIQWDTVLLLDNPSRKKTQGEIWLATPTLIE